MRCTKVQAQDLLLLLPHCLQWSGCKNNIVHDISNCKRCGKCQVGELLALQETYGVNCKIAGGGRQALALVKSCDVKITVAVACEKELRSGILAALPKPVFAITNTRPLGPCKDTRVDLEEVKKVIEKFCINHS